MAATVAQCGGTAGPALLPFATSTAHACTHADSEVIQVVVVVVARVLLELYLSRLVVARLGLVDLGRGRDLSVLDQVTRLVRRVLLDHVRLFVLELAQRKQDDVSVVDPDLVRVRVRVVGRW